MNKKKNKGGRPTKKDKKTVKKLIEGFKRDYTVEEACAYAKISKQTFYNWLDNDKKFLDEIECAKYYLFQAAKNTIGHRISKGDKELAKWFLERRAKRLYAQRTELTGEEGEPVQVTGIIFEKAKKKK